MPLASTHVSAPGQMYTQESIYTHTVRTAYIQYTIHMLRLYLYLYTNYHFKHFCNKKDFFESLHHIPLSTFLTAKVYLASSLQKVSAHKEWYQSHRCMAFLQNLIDFSKSLMILKRAKTGNFKMSRM